MNNEMYLIHGEDYIKHIDEKVLLYAMVKQLCHRVAKLPSNRGNKSLSDLAKSYNVLAEKKFRSWGIPASYLYTHDPDELALLVSNELIEPEEAIEISDLYEMDIKIEKRTSHISATYYFNYGGNMKHLTNIIGMADDLAFFGRKDKAYDIVMSLDFYTHAVYRNGRQVEP